MKNNRKPIFWRRGLALLLAVCLAAGYVPVPGYAEGCTHAHGEDCYEVTTQCVHSHDESCYTDPAIMEAGEEPDACTHVCAEETGCVTKALNCAHVHDSACGEAAEEEPKEEPKPEPQPEGKEEPKEEPKPQEEPKEEPEAPQEPQAKTVTAWTWLDEEEALDPETGKLCLVASEEAPISLDQIMEVLPQAIEATVDGEGETLPVAAWTCGEYPEDGAYEGSFVLEAELPEGYALGDGVEALHVAVEFGGAVTIAANPVAVIVDGTTTEYGTIEAAIEAANGATGSSVTVKLLKDTSWGTKALLVRDMTLDLNGFQLRYDHAANDDKVVCIASDKTLTLTDSEGNGVCYNLTISGQRMVDGLPKYHYGSVVVTGGTWKEGVWHLSRGNYTMTDGNVYEVVTGKSVSVQGGEMGSLFLARNKSNKSVKLSGGCFSVIRADGSASIPSAPILEKGYLFQKNGSKEKLRYNDLPTLTNAAGLANVTVVKCTSHEFETGNPNCIYCNAPCDHTKVDITTGKCYCGEKQVYQAKIGTKGYATLKEAIAAAERSKNATVTLLCNVDVDTGEQVSLTKGTYTLDLNGWKIKLKDIVYININGANVTIKGEASGSGMTAGMGVAVFLTSGSLTIQSGTFSEGAVAARVTGGRLEISGGSFDIGWQVSINKGTNATISGGKFGRITSVGGTLLDLLAPNLAYFYDAKGKNLADGSGPSLSEVYVLPHTTHTFQDGKCGCGLQCEHKTVNQTTGACVTCGKVLYDARLTIGESSRLFESMNDAFRALGERVGTVTLLRDVNVEYFFVYQNNVLDGNGHTITGRLEISLRHDKRSGGVIQNLTLKGSPKVDKDDLRIPPVFGDNCVIYGFEASSGELLALVHDGYAFFTDEGRTTFANSSWEQHWNVLYTGPHTHDFTTGTCACGAQCDHKTIDMTTGKCAACSKQLYQAKIGTTGYATLDAALTAAQETENSTVTMLCDIDVPVTVSYCLTKGTVTLDLNGHKLSDIEKTDGSLFAIKGADFTIKGTAAGSAIQEQRIFAITLLSGNLAIHGGSFGRIDWVGGTLTITDGEFEFLYYSGNPTATISGGTFQSITVYDPFAPSAWHTLKSGYAFFDVDSKKVVDASGQKLKNVYVSTHTHTKRQGYKTCACGYAFPYATVTKAPEPLKLTYTGQTQTLVTQGTAEGGEMLYSLEKDGYYGKTVPFGIVKTYTVYYMVRGDSGHLDTEPESVTVTIKPTKRLLDLTGLNLAGDITIDGVDYPIETSNGTLYVTIPETGDLFTYYGYKNIWASNEHSNYPTSMSVYAIERTPTGSTAREITELQDLLTYAGCSIRISGKQGIRMITALDEATKKALTGKGLAGYTLEEYGTVVSWTDALGNGSFLRLGEDYAHSNYAYRKGEADPVFARKNGIIQYTNVLVLENLTEADYDKDLTLRAYIRLRNTETGETVTLYGGTVTRSIYYVATQNADTYKPGTAGHKFVRKIIDAVENP